jgi:hypothetical protein
MTEPCETSLAQVSAVQRKDTHAIYAMKEMSKKKIKHEEVRPLVERPCRLLWLTRAIPLQCERMVVLEQQVLSKMKSPFVLNLRVRPLLPVLLVCEEGGCSFVLLRCAVFVL